MLSDIARTRPTRSPIQPNKTPPVAAPIKKTDIKTPNQASFTAGLAAISSRSKSLSALGPASGKSPISKPSNIQPKSAAVSASH